MKILVTGAAGLVGAEVCARLIKNNHQVYGLVHHVRELVANNGRPVKGQVDLIPGDVTQTRLGLDEPTWRMLTEQVDLIVHSAAITDFGRPREVYQAVNTTGTAHVLELAAASDARLVHVSTAYVCGEQDGRILESSLDAGQRFGNHYEQSKFDAELLVRKAAADGLAVTVVRPSVVVGAARTGVVREFKNIYVVLKLLSEGRVTSIPGHFDACVDLVGVDHVAALIADVTENLERADGLTLHAVGSSVSMRNMSDVLAEYPSFRVPRYVAPATFSAASLTATERAYWERMLSLYESYFRRRQHFDDSVAAGFRRHKRAAAGPDQLRKIIDYAVRAGYLGTPLPGIAEALAGIGAR
ncbi:SDR family NAD(P)-dependent oxidoreductase [Actinoplanes sp. NPDC026619]|uniref:SDR family NAD(P)-dependent oxidoreductase n=1 Tax=Actinoplanes sp. NPDC026619 TaxID=3155798 RepID=UPI0034014138